MTADSHAPLTELLIYVAQVLVDDVDAVTVDVAELEDDGLTLQLKVAEGDIGKIIGKQGRTARALRNLVSAAARQRHLSVKVDFIGA